VAAAAHRRTEGVMHRYLLEPFQQEPDFGAMCVDCGFEELLARAAEPA
jgi:hypothetical protein